MTAHDRLNKFTGPGAAAGIAILNGFGRSLGDSVIGLQALTLSIEAGRFPRHVALLRLPGLPNITRGVYDAAADLATVRTLPWFYEKPGALPDAASGYREIIDLRDFAFDPAFRGVAMIDYFLACLGVDADAVPSARKRNDWLANRVRPIAPSFAPGYVLLCPMAAMAMRSMPAAFHDRALGWLAAHAERPVLSQAFLPREQTLAGLCGLVAHASLIVSADTAMVHLADAFSVPCLAFFNTHRPEWRARDYPLCRGIHLPARLPLALEFSRGAADLAAAEAAWFPKGDDLAWLRELLIETMAEFGVLGSGRVAHARSESRCR
jgi:Glycosyltransferase family 9 (heptosyltransferase)